MMISVTAIAIFTGDLTRREISAHARVEWLAQLPFIGCEMVSNLSKNGSSISMPCTTKKVEASTTESLDTYSFKFDNTSSASIEQLLK